MKLAMRNL